MSFRNNNRSRRQMSHMDKVLAEEQRQEKQREGKAAFLQRQARRDQRARYERERSAANRQSSWQDERNRQVQQRQTQRPAHFRPGSNVFRPKVPPVVKKLPKWPVMSAFAYLDSDSEEDVGPSLPSRTVVKQIENSASTWKGFREKPVVEKAAKLVEKPKPVVEKVAKLVEKPKPVVEKPKVTFLRKQKHGSNWADACDSDYEDTLPFNDAWDSE